MREGCSSRSSRPVRSFRYRHICLCRLCHLCRLCRRSCLCRRCRIWRSPGPRMLACGPCSQLLPACVLCSQRVEPQCAKLLVAQAAARRVHLLSWRRGTARARVLQIAGRAACEYGAARDAHKWRRVDLVATCRAKGRARERSTRSHRASPFLSSLFQRMCGAARVAREPFAGRPLALAAPV